MKEPAPLKRKLDALYTGSPEDFVAGRDALAKELRAAGDADLAKEIKALRRPSVAAGLLNRAALGHPKELKAFASAVGKLRKASAKAKGGALRDAARAEREAASAVVALAEQEGGEGAALERIAETLKAAAADEKVEDLFVRGRLEKERRAASIGFGLDVGGGDDEDAVAEPPKAKKKDEARPARAKKKAEAKPAKASAAERKREQAANRKREQARKRGQEKVEKAQGALERAVNEQQRADDETESAVENLTEAKERLDNAKTAGRDAAAAVKVAKQVLRNRERELADLD